MRVHKISYAEEVSEITQYKEIGNERWYLAYST